MAKVVFHLVNKHLVSSKSNNFALAAFEGIIPVCVGRVVVFEVIVGRLESLALQLVDGMDVEGDVILQTSGLGLAGQLSSELGLLIKIELKYM